MREGDVAERNHKILFFLIGILSQLIAGGGVNVNRVDEDKRTPLHILLSLEGHNNDAGEISHRLKILKMLLAAGADSSLQDRNGWTPLHFAAQFSPLPLINAFLRESDCEVNEKNLDGTTALHYLSRRKVSEEEDRGEYANVVKEMLSRGADVNSQTKSGERFLISFLREDT